METSNSPPADGANVSEQGDLFADAQPVPWAGFDERSTTAALPSRPTCNLCGKPAFWRPNKRQWSVYCGAQSCISRVRLCKYCGEPFDVTSANGRYCSDDHRRAQYISPKSGRIVVCPVDGTEHDGRNRWQLCGQCWSTIRPVRIALTAHRVPTDLVAALVKNPFCPIENCGRPLLERQPGSGRYALAVDHDHDLGCHPGPNGCPACIRGLICWLCNVAIGQMDDDPARLRGLASYLDGWRARTGA
jgi:hypothetical protein